MASPFAPFSAQILRISAINGVSSRDLVTAAESQTIAVPPQDQFEAGAASPVLEGPSREISNYVWRRPSEAYPALHRLFQAAYPDYALSADEICLQDQSREPKGKFGRWVVGQDGHVVGMGEYTQLKDMYHPRKFQIKVAVHPERRNQGLGTVLYDRIVDALRSLNPLSIRAEVREDMTEGLRFLEDRGFYPDTKYLESFLDVTEFDFSPYAEALAKGRAHGIEIKTFEELKTDPNRDRKLYALYGALMRDVPFPEDQTEIDFGYFVEHILNYPGLLPDGCFVAVKDGEYVGMSTMKHRRTKDDLSTGLTGVKREHRNGGLALSLKLRGIAYAQERGYRFIRASNEAGNEPILHLNERLGFVKRPAWISLVKNFH